MIKEGALEWEPERAAALELVCTAGFLGARWGQTGGERASLELSWAGGELFDVQGLRKDLQVATYI